MDKFNTVNKNVDSVFLEDNFAFVTFFEDILYLSRVIYMVIKNIILSLNFNAIQSVY